MGLLGVLGGTALSTLGAVGGKIGSGLIDGFVGDYFNRKQESRAFDRNVAMWNMENQYNSPKEQMKRYKEAGLNPNLVYNSLGGSTNIGSVGMANNSVDTSNSNYANPYYHYMNLKNRQYEDAVKNQQLAKMENENKLLAEKIENEKNKRNPPKTVADNQGGANQLKGEVNEWDVSLGRWGIPVRFGRRKDGSYYGQLLGYRFGAEEMKDAKKSNYGSYGNYSVPRVYDAKTGKYINQWGELE